MIYLLNYANETYESVRKINTESGRKRANFKEVLEYNEDSIEVEFRKEHESILSEKRGNGLWLWKPYIVFDALNKIDDQDIIFYCDSAAFFLKDITSYLNKMKNDFCVYDIPLIESEFTYENTFIQLGLNESKYRDTNQIMASFFAIRKSDYTVNFVKEWLQLCCRKDILSPVATKKDMFHREDQSIFSLLCKKYNIEPSLDISQFGKYPVMYYYKENWTYKPHRYVYKHEFIICHHRENEIGFEWRMKVFVFKIIPRTIMNFMVLKRRGIDPRKGSK